ncbi:MAG: DUF2079 domain-containing protein [Dehalococcoidia bacterium]
MTTADPRRPGLTQMNWRATGEEALASGVLIVLVGASFAASVALTVTRWNHLEMSFFDFGYFDQIIWNTAHGRWFQSSFTPYHFLAQHFQPILLPFVLAYRLGAGPLFLTIAQSAVVIVAAFPLYGAARCLGLRPALATLVASTFLLSPYLHRTLDYDFHPEVMVALPAFASAWLTAAGRWRGGAALALTTLLFKEDAVFVALALAALLWWRGGRREGVVTAATALVWTALLVLVLMPFGRDGHESNVMDRYTYLWAPGEGSAGRYGLLLAPWRAAAVLLSDRLLTAALFVLGTGPFAIVRPWIMWVLLPGLALVLLSTHPPQHSLELHYGAVLLPVGVIAGLVGTSWLARRLPTAAVGALAVLPVLAASFALSPLFDTRGGAAPTAQHRAAVEAALALIPPDAPVAAQSALAARLSRRVSIHEFPGGWPDAQWIVVDAFGQRSAQSAAAGFDEALREVRATHTRVYDRDGVEVFRAGP